MPLVSAQNVTGKADERRPKKSVFIVTINTNYKPRTMAERRTMSRKLEGAVGTMLDDDHFGGIFTFKEGGFSDIKNIKARYNVEIGNHPKGSRVHSHLVIEVEHNAKIHLDVAEIKELMVDLIDDFRVGSVYVNVKAVRTARAVRNYILKPGYAPSDRNTASSRRYGRGGQ